MFTLLLICLGGALGTAARYTVDGLISGYQVKHIASFAVFPLGTLAVNVFGSFAIGFVSAISGPSLGRVWLRPAQRDFLMIGCFGGFTTFSSYALQSLNLARDGEWLFAWLNVLGSNSLCLLAVYLGLVCGLFLQSRFHGGLL